MEAPQAPRALENIEHPVQRLQRQQLTTDPRLEMIARTSGRGRAAAYATDRTLLADVADPGLLRVAVSRPISSVLADSYTGRTSCFGLFDAYPKRTRGLAMPSAPLPMNAMLRDHY